LVLDEPFSGLDVINIEIFVEIIREFQQKGAVIIFSSHQIDHVESFCEQLVILDKGKTVLAGKIKDIKKDFKKHNIRLVADGISKEQLLAIKGVYDCIENSNEWIVKIENENISKDVFEYIKTLTNVRKFEVEEASLS